MNIYVKGIYKIQGTIHSSAVENTIRFTVPIESKPEVIVNMILDENKIESFYETEISTEMYSMLQEFQIKKIFDAEKISPDLENELSEIRSNNENAIEKVLSLIKYGFNQTNLGEDLFSFSSNGLYWSLNQSEWNIIPTVLTSIIEVRNYIILNEVNMKIIQKHILDDYKPFFELNHLHKAINEKNPRYKWIDATIAAELAIKEFLAKKVPSIESLLMEVPSPPLYKLYGSILMEYAGEKSPKLSQIQKGVEIRNKLIHRPDATPIDKCEANTYVHDVEIAIYHLLSLLYTEDSEIKMLYENTKRVEF